MCSRLFRIHRHRPLPLRSHLSRSRTSPARGASSPSTRTPNGSSASFETPVAVERGDRQRHPGIRHQPENIRRACPPLALSCLLRQDLSSMSNLSFSSPYPFFLPVSLPTFPFPSDPPFLFSPPCHPLPSPSPHLLSPSSLPQLLSFPSPPPAVLLFNNVHPPPTPSPLPLYFSSLQPAFGGRVSHRPLEAHLSTPYTPRSHPRPHRN